MEENSDEAQARVFAEMLATEIALASSRVEESEESARLASRVGDSRSEMWHSEQARALRQALYELHRQLDALFTRFPGAKAHTYS